MHQEATIDAFEVKLTLTRIGCRQGAAFEHAHIGFRRGDSQSIGIHARRDDDFDKLTANDVFHGRFIQRAVEGDDAAKGGFWVSGKGEVIGLKDAGFRNRDAAGIGMFDNHASRLDEGFDAFQCRIGIGDVVVRQLFALQLLGGRDGGFRGAWVDVEGGFLVRVFTVTHVLGFVELSIEGAREGRRLLECRAFLGDFAKIIGNRAIIACRVLVGFNR